MRPIRTGWATPRQSHRLTRRPRQSFRLATKPPERTWIQSLMILVVTLVLFASAGFFSSTPTDLAMLVGVLLFHELGHYLGMRLFNYQDVKMFFIPFFGAAVSGRSTSVAGYKEAIVLLLGPVPGILLGGTLGVVCMFHDLPLVRNLAMLLMGINAFNLLPMLPLDGGRLLHLIVFSRQRHLEAIFRVVMAILLGLMAIALSAWFLGLIALFILMGTRMNYTISMLAQKLRGTKGPAFDKLADFNPTAEIPREQAIPLAESVRAAFPAIQPPATLANLARQVWERMHLRPPGLVASIALLGVLAGAFFGTLVAAFVLQIPISSEVDQRRPDGTIVRVRETRNWGRLQSTTELAPDGRLQGKYVEYDLTTGKRRVEGTFSGDEPTGVWTQFGANGQIEVQRNEGKP